MILAIDQGTTGSTCLVFDEHFEPVGRAYKEFNQSFPRPGWVEHDLSELWEVTQTVALAALEDAGVRKGELLAVGLTNQRETVGVWDRISGKPLAPAIVWQDRRGAARCEELKAAGVEALVRERTGLVLDPYFSATKMEWLFKNIDGLRARARDGAVAVGTIDSWLAFKLTGEHLTDASNASRTMLYNISSGAWDPELLELFDIPEAVLPRVVPSAGSIGETLPAALDGHIAPVAGIAGDQQAALFGHGCVDPGMGKNTYGTGSFVLLNTGFVAPEPAEGVLSTVAWQLGASRTYAMEGSIFATGAAVQWLRDGLGIIEQASETEALAQSLEGNDGVYFVPALTGLGSPHWDPDARGTIVGLTRGVGRAHLARATLEAIAYQTVDAVRCMESASGHQLTELKVDGGASANRWLMQFQADLLGVPVVAPEILETTAVGAARLAGVGVGLWSVSDLRDSLQERSRYEPGMEQDEVEGLLDGWHDALARTLRNFGASTR